MWKQGKGPEGIVCLVVYVSGAMSGGMYMYDKCMVVCGKRCFYLVWPQFGFINSQDFSKAQCGLFLLSSRPERPRKGIQQGYSVWSHFIHMDNMQFHPQVILRITVSESKKCSPRSIKVDPSFELLLVLVGCLVLKKPRGIEERPISLI